VHKRSRRWNCRSESCHSALNILRYEPAWWKRIESICIINTHVKYSLLWWKGKSWDRKAKSTKHSVAANTAKVTAGVTNLEKEPSPIARMKFAAGRPQAYDSFMAAMTRYCCWLSFKVPDVASFDLRQHQGMIRSNSDDTKRPRWNFFSLKPVDLPSWKRGRIHLRGNAKAVCFKPYFLFRDWMNNMELPSQQMLPLFAVAWTVCSSVMLIELPRRRQRFAATHGLAKSRRQLIWLEEPLCYFILSMELEKEVKCWISFEQSELKDETLHHASSIKNVSHHFWRESAEKYLM